MSGTQSWNKAAEFPRNHRVITPSDSVDMFDDVVIVCGSTGDISVTDKGGTTVVYVGLPAGAVVPVIAKRINATGTTVNPVVAVY